MEYTTRFTEYSQLFREVLLMWHHRQGAFRDGLEQQNGRRIQWRSTVVRGAQVKARVGGRLGLQGNQATWAWTS